MPSVRESRPAPTNSRTRTTRTVRPARRFRTASAAVLLTTSAFASLAVAAAPAANAAVDPASCVYGYDLSVPRMSATCTAVPNPHGWYLRVACDTFHNTTIHVNGTIVYTVGRGTSIAVCPSNTELGGSQLVNL